MIVSGFVQEECFCCKNDHKGWVPEGKLWLCGFCKAWHKKEKKK